MAIDGSFNLKLALETFSVRCPKVAAFPCFTSILSKVKFCTCYFKFDPELWA
jgi:hypothetical protein